jgi:PA14 domain
MSRLLSGVSRAGVALALFLVVLGVSRWGPVYAEPPVDARALPFAGLAVLLAVAAGLSGHARASRPVWPIVGALVATLAALALVVLLRPASGLRLEVSGPGSNAVFPDTGLDVSGRDLRDQVEPRRATLRWQGQLRAPASGTYAIRARGRGAVSVRIDGREVLAASSESLRAEQPLALAAGLHAIGVELRPQGPGLRLQLGWTRPGRFGPWRDDVVPPRYLGPTSSLWWALTDFLSIAVAILVAVLAWLAPWDRPRPLPAPQPVTRRQLAVSIAGYAVLLAAMSWPLVLDPVHQGMTDRPDGRLNAWILAWDVHALTHEPGRLFQAPIFHPLPDALAFSENLLLPAVLGAPALWAGGPVLAYNFVLLLSLLVSGLGVELLVRRCSGDRLAAFVAGAVFAAGAHRWVRLAHLHAEVTLFLPFALLALDRFFERRTLRRALLVGLLLALQGFSSVYLGAITATALATAVAVGLFGGFGLRDLAKLGAGFVLAGLLLFPLAAPYFRMRAFQGVEFTRATVAEYATTLESYAASGTRAYGGITRRHLDPERVQDTLFPGLVTLIVGLSGLAVAPRRYRAVIVVASALAVLLSLGPATGAYRFLHDHVVLFRGVRALSRFSLIPVLGLSVLVGFALSGRRWWASVAALLFMMLESTNAPIRYGDYRGPSEAARWLAGREGAVVALPLGERDTEVMLDGIAHWRPLLNGDSGFLPRPYNRAMELLEGPLTEEGLRFLRAVGVRHILTRGEPGRPAVAAMGEERILEVPPGPNAMPVVPGKAVPTFWTRDGALIDLGERTAVSRVSFELTDGPWIASPTLQVSSDGLSWESRSATASLADATLSSMQDPRHARGELRFEKVETRFLRLDPGLPAAPEAFGVSP